MSPTDDAIGVLEDVITTRRSVRQYTDAGVDVGLLVSLVRLGTWAPSGGNAQTWRFVVVIDEVVVQALHAVSPGMAVRPPAVIAICQDWRLAEERSGPSGRDRCAPMDAAMAAQTIMLAAHAHGLGTCAVLSFHPPSVQKILRLPEHLVPELLLMIGHPEKLPAPPARESDGIIHLNRWEGPDGGAGGKTSGEDGAHNRSRKENAE